MQRKNIQAFIYPAVLLGTLAFAQQSKAQIFPTESTPGLVNPLPQPAQSDWLFQSVVSLPFRGFQIQTGAHETDTQDSLRHVSYAPSPSLEGQVFLGYKGLGFSYSRTLAASSLDATQNLPASRNEGFKFSFLAGNNLLEASQQYLSGMKTTLNIDGATEKSIVRKDIELSDTRLRWVYGIPVWGSSQANSLSNFYSQAHIAKGETSLDLLTSVEFVQQEISGSSPFVPAERQAAFGEGSTLSKITSRGIGAGGGFGFTKLIAGLSYFSLGALLGGNYNFSKAHFVEKEESSNGFGGYTNAWMSVQFVFGQKDQQNLGFKLAHTDWIIPAKDNKVSSMDSSLALNYGIAF